jgi:hypothetical protein
MAAPFILSSGPIGGIIQPTLCGAACCSQVADQHAGNPQTVQRRSTVAALANHFACANLVSGKSQVGAEF